MSGTPLGRKTPRDDIVSIPTRVHAANGRSRTPKVTYVGEQGEASKALFVAAWRPDPNPLRIGEFVKTKVAHCVKWHLVPIPTVAL